MLQEAILEDIKDVLRALKRLREKRGMTQANVAACLDISTDGYRKIENGRNALTLSRLLKICQTIDVSPAEFFSEKTGHLFEKEIQKNEIVFLKAQLNQVLTEVWYLREQNNKLLQCINPDLNDMRVVRDK